MALTEADSRLDWLIPYPGPSSSEERKKFWESHKCNSDRLEILISLRGEKKTNGESILKAIQYFLVHIVFGQKMVKAIKIADNL